MITTPAGTKYAHLIPELECTGEMLYTFTEGADRTGTTSLPIINRHRVGTPTASTLVVHRGYTGGATDGAVALRVERSGTTNVASKTISAGGARSMNEFILKMSICL